MPIYLSVFCLFLKYKLRKVNVMARRKKAPLSALAVRMNEDLVLAGKSPGTIKRYLSAVRRLAAYYNRSPDRLSENQVRKYLVYLTVKKKWRAARYGPLLAL